MDAPLSSLSDRDLDALLDALRAKKESVLVELRKVVAEHDHRAMLRDMKTRYGDRAVQRITGAGGIKSAESFGKPGA